MGTDFRSSGFSPSHAPARLPQVAMLEYFGRLRQTNVSDVLARELDDFASAHFEELRSAIPGFAEAFEWPRQDETRRPC